MPSVLVLSAHAIAAEAAREGLRHAAAVTSATLGHPTPPGRPDVVVVEQTLAPMPPMRLEGIASVAGDAPILHVVAMAAGGYHWIRVRSHDGLFRYEASGMGSLAEAVQLATGR